MEFFESFPELYGAFRGFPECIASQVPARARQRGKLAKGQASQGAS